MDHQTFSRRDMLKGGAMTAILAAAVQPSIAVEKTPGASPFSFCLNTSTIRGQKVPIEKEIDLIAEAGYDGIEPWIGEMDRYVKSGGKLKDLRKRLEDKGLSVEGAIGFASWIVDDDQQRARALEQMKRDMDTMAQVGGTRIAAPPAGAAGGAKLDPYNIADRYRAILELGEKMGVIPMVEIWGRCSNLGRLGEAVFTAVESGHPKACLLPDIYHIYKSGSEFEGLTLLSDAAIPQFHVNDYPDIPKDRIKDGDRVYPGDGIAPVADILNMLSAREGTCVLSLELFNPEYWKQDAFTVAKTGLAKMKACVP